MAMIRAGETLPVEGAYDPAADEAAATAAFRARRRDAESKLAGNEAWQSREQLEEVSASRRWACTALLMAPAHLQLRRIQAERIEVGKMKQLCVQSRRRLRPQPDLSCFLQRDADIVQDGRAHGLKVPVAARARRAPAMTTRCRSFCSTESVLAVRR